MLGQADFVDMLGELRRQLLKNINNIENLLQKVDDSDFIYRLTAVSQSKKRHMSVMNAMASQVTDLLRLGSDGKNPEHSAKKVKKTAESKIPGALPS